MPWPVSYTHLDVYKRQALNGESEEAKKTVAPAEFQWDDGKIDFLDEYKLVRGDGYKRQDRRSRNQDRCRSGSALYGYW